MKKPLVDQIPFAKLVAIFAAGFGIGLGLCGLGFFLPAHGVGRGRGDEEFGMAPISLVSLVIVIVSFVGLIVTLLMWALLAVLESFGIGGDKGEVQKLFDDSGETRNGDRAEDSKIDHGPELPKPPDGED
jgi:hypothetical protein